MVDLTEYQRAVIDRCATGAISAPVALALLVDDVPDRRVLADLVDAALAAADRAAGARRRIEELGALIPVVEDGCLRVVRALHEHGDPGELSTGFAGLAAGRGAPGAAQDGVVGRCREAFDRLVQESEEASVALYSLGSPELLELATREVVALLERWGVLVPGRTVLDYGCGIGRLAPLVAPRVRALYGVDVSPNMVAAARRRSAHLPNTHFAECSGEDLAALADSSFDLVIAMDSLPYVWQGGPGLVERVFGELSRVLRPGGDLVLLNVSYRDDPAADRSDVERLAAAYGLDVLVSGSAPFELWDALAFHLRRR